MFKELSSETGYCKDRIGLHHLPSVYVAKTTVSVAFSENFVSGEVA